MLELLEDNHKSMSIENRAEIIKHLRISSENTITLLKNLVSWAKIQKKCILIEKQKISISNLFKRTYELCNILALKKGQTLNFSTDITHIGYFDDNTIATVLRNLLTNAIKFSKPNEIINISSKIENENIIISVEDRGIGINKCDIKNLFNIEKMKPAIGTEGEAGTGLGLILCKEFVSLNGGEIWLKSELGIGSTFLFSVEKFEQ